MDTDIVTKIVLKFSNKDFQDIFDSWGDNQFKNFLKDGVRSGIEFAFKNTFKQNLIRVKIHDTMHVFCKDGIIPLDLHIKSIHKVGSFLASSIKVEFDLSKDTLISDLVFECSDGSELSHWIPNASTQPSVKFKPMKRWNRILLRFYQISIPAKYLPISEKDVSLCSCPSETLKPSNNTLLTFKCFVCGKSYLCECFRGIPERLSTRERYDTEPYQKLLDTTPYRADTCHLCRGVPVTTGVKQQGQSEIRAYYWRYINDFAIGKDIGFRNAENEIRDRLKVPRIGEGWLGEANLLRIVQTLYPEFKVIHQASPEWLGRQRFDIFIPEMNLAIEYNGEQHYSPIKLFGGQAGFEATQKRDKEKRIKARDAGVKLLEFKYDEEISPENVKQKITKFLENT